MLRDDGQACDLVNHGRNPLHFKVGDAAWVTVAPAQASSEAHESSDQAQRVPFGALIRIGPPDFPNPLGRSLPNVANPARYLSRNEGYRYRSYGEVFRRYFLKAKDPVAHPLWQRQGPPAP